MAMLGIFRSSLRAVTAARRIRCISTARSFSLSNCRHVRASNPCAAPFSSCSGAGDMPEQVSTVQDHVDKVLSCKTSKIHPVWHKRLAEVDRPAARGIINQLTGDNVLGYQQPIKAAAATTKRKGTLLDYVLKEKKKHADKVLLVRVGDFYECFGVDAVMMVQHAGLNPMGSKARAGCPIRNVQATLDSLTSAGLVVAVYEELKETSASSTKTSGLKSRGLSQIVSPGTSTYLYDLRLRHEDIEFRVNKPVIGIFYSGALGYSLCEVHLDERCVQISDRVSEEALKICVQYSGCLEPIYTVGFTGAGSAAEIAQAKHTLMSILPGNSRTISISYSVGSELQFHELVLQKIEHDLEINTSGFRVMRRPYRDRPAPVYVSTALQIGLLPNPNVPDLISCLVPNTANAGTVRFLRRWLLTPPPYHIADQFRNMCSLLNDKDSELVLPERVSIPPIGKIVSLLRSAECNVALFRDVYGVVSSVVSMVNHRHKILNIDRKVSNAHADLVDSLRELTEFESGMSVDLEAILQEGVAILDRIDRTIYVNSGGFAEPHFSNRGDDKSPNARSTIISRDPHLLISDSFFDRNEMSFRCELKRGDEQPVIEYAFQAVDDAAAELCDAVQSDFPLDCGVTFDVFNNLIMIKKLPEAVSSDDSDNYNMSKTDDNSTIIDASSHAGAPRPEYITVRDRFGKVLPRRWTTARVAAARDKYVSSTAQASDAVSATLKKLSDDLAMKLVYIVQAAHWAQILEVGIAHTVSSRQKGWCLPILQPSGRTTDAAASDSNISVATSHDAKSGELSAATKSSSQRMTVDTKSKCGDTINNFSVYGMIPYWLSRDLAVSNVFDMNGMFLLTAPNMAGKSTLMRSALATALLGNSGLFVPCLSANIPRFDSFFLRTASYDVPSEGKSAFALEMEDVRIMLRDSTARSIVMVDELGKGTSARDGASLAGAILEELNQRQCLGVFATHLHELFDLPLDLMNTTNKRMGIEHVVGGSPKWTYTLEDGLCTDSLAMQTAMAYCIPDSIVKRAQKLGEHFDAFCRQNGDRLYDNMAQQETKLSRPVDYSLQDAASVLLECLSIVGSNATSSNNTTAEASRAVAEHPTNACDSVRVSHVPANEAPPPSLEGHSCIYVLRVTQSKEKQSQKMNSFYVGETESIAQRLCQHRLKFSGKERTVQVECITVCVPNKSIARRIETAVIRSLKRKGYLLLNSVVDENHTLFGSR